MVFESTVQNIIQRTPTVKSFQIPRPEGFEFKAGQFMEVTIKVNDEPKAKYFTISVSPTESSYIEFTKRITDSDFSKVLNCLKPGDWIKINGPIGQFILEKAQGKIAFLSGGIGITPIRSMCAFCTVQKIDKDIVLLYGNRSSSDIPFRAEFDKMQGNNFRLRVIHTLDREETGWDGLVGFISKDMITQEIPDYEERTFFVCGPPKMVEGMAGILQDELNLPGEQIVVENFSGY